jgi:hypothetical protein
LRLERAGYESRLVAAGAVDGALRSELARVSDAWRGSNVERGFSMAMDDPFRERETVFGACWPSAASSIPSGRRYLCFERLSDLPVVGVAYLRVESLLTAPGPWARRRPLKV